MKNRKIWIIFIIEILIGNLNSQLSAEVKKTIPSSTSTVIQKKYCWGKISINGNRFDVRVKTSETSVYQLCKEVLDLEGFKIEYTSEPFKIAGSREVIASGETTEGDVFRNTGTETINICIDKIDKSSVTLTVEHQTKPGITEDYFPPEVRSFAPRGLLNNVRKSSIDIEHLCKDTLYAFWESLNDEGNTLYKERQLNQPEKYKQLRLEWEKIKEATQ